MFWGEVILQFWGLHGNLVREPLKVTSGHGQLLGSSLPTACQGAELRSESANQAFTQRRDALGLGDSPELLLLTLPVY